ncbi:MAG: thiamine diphosphokinase [Clostridia bacterium]|nr:thiamine diphosphokinase [Clostridia bacterium]
MRAVIIGNGTIEDYEYIGSIVERDDYIICADGGARHASALGLDIDMLIGDFDSTDLSAAKEIRRYPVHKDFTDGELCAEYARERGFDETLLVAMTGTRLDHTINNIMLLFRLKNSRLVNEYCEIYPLCGELKIVGKKGKTLSIIPLNGNLEGINACGLEYPLKNDTLRFGEARGNSNVILDDTVKISVEKGMGIVIIGNGE